MPSLTPSGHAAGLDNKKSDQSALQIHIRKSRCEKVNPSKSLTQEIFLCTVRAAHKIGLFIYVSPLNIYGVLRESSDMSIPPSCNCNAAIEIIGRVPLSHSDPRRCSTAVPTCVV
ncbi:predicted protein [Sclerotinia sclerotiorum 1980 UF-70]|uniref:Uncharacterized protein n=1 Tax=Sclerotinia sclerotiorum (strain ATCC 18683 / 1980 / Ss-1) TaxID=665079 RepID=A7F843_SCLS1|nr:predicted protein [Sclerotinia sclerotiorum 1980 UF-70]EDN98914.1 predicted protein [Sclerotinia sclerotiorum 1980 UF-70]